MKPIRGGLLSGLGVLLLLALVPATSWAAFPGESGRIAYAGPSPTELYYSDIFTVLPNGSGLQQLTDNAVSEYEPSWSADGRRLVYIRRVRGSIGGWQVFTMDASGENQTRVTNDNGIDLWPGFSPNGRRIVYSKDNVPVADEDTPRRRSIFKIRLDGTLKRLVVTGDAEAPQYSPNGKRIVFHGTPEGKRQNGIWKIRPDGSGLRRLSAPGMGERYDEYPEWSPDGRHIVFLRCDPDPSPGACPSTVYVMRADGSHKHPIQSIYGEDSPAYSPAGDRIALTGLASELCSYIYTVSLTGSNPQPVTNNCDDSVDEAYVRNPSWQPIPQP